MALDATAAQGKAKTRAEFSAFANKFGTPSSAAAARRPLAAASGSSGASSAFATAGAAAAEDDAAARFSELSTSDSAGLSASRAAAAAAAAHPNQKRVSNSTSTIYARNLVSNLDSDEVLSAIASVLSSLMAQAPGAGDGVAPSVDREFSSFDERTYVPREARKKLRWVLPTLGRASFSTAVPVPTAAAAAADDAARTEEGVPPKDEMFKFLKRTSRRASFSPENTVIALILINRLLSTSRTLVVHAYNWRLVYLTALLVAQKLYDDVSLDNASFPIVWRAAVGIEATDTLDLRAFNEMEARFLELLRFSVFISRALYASFCFELRAVYEAENPALAFPINPLSPADAAKLEAKTMTLPPTMAQRLSKSHMETPMGGSEGVRGGIPARAVLS